MACVTCEHCRNPVNDEAVLRDGFSYHKECEKCYVCSETNLQRAEMFKGVIFCSACSKRIFQGCASARKTKQRTSSRVKESKSRRKRDRQKASEKGLDKHLNGVIELAQLAGSTSSSYISVPSKKNTIRKTVMTTELALQGDIGHYEVPKVRQKYSLDMGTSTLVTQEFLKSIPDIQEVSMEKTLSRKRFAEVIPRAVSPIKRRRRKRDFSPPRGKSRAICSDLRIAEGGTRACGPPNELGASTEIANMALRKKSEVPVIIKSDYNKSSKQEKSSGSNTTDIQESGSSQDEKRDSSKSIMNKKLTDLHLSSIVKLPLKYFKDHILARSSLVSVMLCKNKFEETPITKCFKKPFYDEALYHQDRGIKRLYSTINRRKKPYQMGWLGLVSTVSQVMSPESSNYQDSRTEKFCKHYNTSHSYRCMRAQAMKLAGPTRNWQFSEGKSHQERWQTSQNVRSKDINFKKVIPKTLKPFARSIDAKKSTIGELINTHI